MIEALRHNALRCPAPSLRTPHGLSCRVLNGAKGGGGWATLLVAEKMWGDVVGPALAAGGWRDAHAEELDEFLVSERGTVLPRSVWRLRVPCPEAELTGVYSNLHAAYRARHPQLPCRCETCRPGLPAAYAQVLALLHLWVMRALASTGEPGGVSAQLLFLQVRGQMAAAALVCRLALLPSRPLPPCPNQYKPTPVPHPALPCPALQPAPARPRAPS